MRSLIVALAVECERSRRLPRHDILPAWSWLGDCYLHRVALLSGIVRRSSATGRSENRHRHSAARPTAERTEPELRSVAAGEKHQSWARSGRCRCWPFGWTCLGALGGSRRCKILHNIDVCVGSTIFRANKLGDFGAVRTCFGGVTENGSARVGDNVFERREEKLGTQGGSNLTF